LRYQVLMNRKQRRAQGRPANHGRATGGAPSPLAGWLSTALDHHQAGRSTEAERVCRLILSVDPGDAQTLHLLGLIEHQGGRSSDAIEHIRAAIARDGRDPAFHHNLGNVLKASGRPTEAIRCYERALGLAPDSVDTLYNLGNSSQELGQLERAIGYFERAVRLRPDAIELHNNLGTALQDLGRHDEAIACYHQGLALRPDAVELLDNLAGALRAQGQLEAAQASYERALALKPNRVESHIGLGAVSRDFGRLEDAVRCYERALALAPDHPEARINLGVVLVSLSRPAEAIVQYQRVLAMQPDRAETHNNFGIALEHQGRYAEALACYAQALALKPDYAEAHFNRSHALLVTGGLDEGWQEYEWRFAVARYNRNFDRPSWSGESLARQTILIHAEQGFGDTLQFIRYVPAVAERGGKIVLEVPKPLVRLARTVAGASEVVAAGDPLPKFDRHCPMLSLPRILKTNIATIPNIVPYLSAETERVETWRECLPKEGLKIGIAWQGNPLASMDKRRSVPLIAFAPIAAMPGVRLISLQKHDGLDQLHLLPAGMQVETFGPDFDAGPDAFLDTAAIMMCLDVVIACDTSVAHLAGALGRPIWLALSHNPDWRWLTERTDSPWYPNARLFRQKQPGDWRGVMGEIAVALAQMVR
jgi:tetratricopeptide (TPR) repeat protein